MTGARAYQRVSSLPFQKMHEEALVVDTRTREVHLLNVTATRVWDLLETPRTAEQLLSVLTEEFDAAPEVLRADVQALLSEMGAKGLVGAPAGEGESDQADRDPNEGAGGGSASGAP